MYSVGKKIWTLKTTKIMCVLLNHCKRHMTHRCPTCSRSVGFAKMPQIIFSGQDYLGFALADEVLHFNDRKREHAGIVRQMGLGVCIHF